MCISMFGHSDILPSPILLQSHQTPLTFSLKTHTFPAGPPSASKSRNIDLQIMPYFQSKGNSIRRYHATRYSAFTIPRLSHTTYQKPRAGYTSQNKTMTVRCGFSSISFPPIKDNCKHSLWNQPYTDMHVWGWRSKLGRDEGKSIPDFDKPLYVGHFVRGYIFNVVFKCRWRLQR